MLLSIGRSPMFISYHIHGFLALKDQNKNDEFELMPFDPLETFQIRATCSALGGR